MKAPTKLNVIGGTAAACSFIFLLGSWPMQWFGTGPLATSFWFVGLALVPVSGIYFLLSIGIGMRRGARAHAYALATSTVLLAATGTAWLALFRWLCKFE